MVTTYLQYNKEVLSDFFKFQLMKKSKVKWAYYGIAILCFAIGLLQIFIWENKTVGYVVCGLAIVLAAIFPFQIKMVIKREVANMVNHLDVKLVFDEVGCTQYITEKKSYTDEWKSFCYVYETKKYLYFYTNKYEAIIVCKAIINEEEKNTLLGKVKEHNIKFKVRK